MDLMNLSQKLKAVDETFDASLLSIQNKHDILDTYAKWLSKMAQEHSNLAKSFQEPKQDLEDAEWIKIRQVHIPIHQSIKRVFLEWNS